ncbi:MAG TPA: retention module-containing protein, partial [Methylotenera sp.]
MALIGRVVGMTGTASLILGNGDKRDLQLGDSIQTGDTIQTPRGVEVDLQLANGRVIHISAEQLVAFTEDLADVFVPNGLDSSIDLATIDTVIKAIEDGKDINAVLEETAAGLAGQSNAYGFGFVDLLRINAELSGSRFVFDSNVAGAQEFATDNLLNEVVPVLDNTAPTTTPVILAAIDEDSGTITITSAQLLANASDADGPNSLSVANLVASSGTLIDNGDGTWSFTPDTNDDGEVSFSYDIADGLAVVSGSASLDLTAVNDAPVAVDDSITATEDTAFTSVVSLIANDTDVDGPSKTAVAGT